MQHLEHSLKLNAYCLLQAKTVNFMFNLKRIHNSSNKETDVLSLFSRNWTTTLQENEFWLNVYTAKGKSTAYIFEASVY